MPVSWEQWPPRRAFVRLRGPKGGEMVLQGNCFVDRILPASVIRGLTDAEMAVYRRSYTEPGESRRPTLTWPREIPIAGEPADVVEVGARVRRVAHRDPASKLPVNADPGGILVGQQRERCRRWPNRRAVTVEGSHVHLGGFPARDRPGDCGLVPDDGIGGRGRRRQRPVPRRGTGARTRRGRPKPPPRSATAPLRLRYRSSRFRILPVGPFGSASMNSTMRGYLYAARCSRLYAMISSGVAR